MIYSFKMPPWIQQRAKTIRSCSRTTTAAAAGKAASVTTHTTSCSLECSTSCARRTRTWSRARSASSSWSHLRSTVSAPRRPRSPTLPIFVNCNQSHPLFFNCIIWAVNKCMLFYFSKSDSEDKKSICSTFCSSSWVPGICIKKNFHIWKSCL